MQKLILLKSYTKYLCGHLLLLFIAPANAFADVISIADKTNFMKIGSPDGYSLSADFELTASFDLDPAIDDTYIAGTFSGTFDGNGHTVSGLTRPIFDQITGNAPSYNPDTESWIDEDKAIVKDLILVTAGWVVGRGILANDANSYVLIENVGTKGIINGGVEDSVGGIVGSLTEGGETSGLITNSYSTANVYGDDTVGGLVGVVGSNGQITESYASGSISGDQNIGGLVGLTYGNISNSFATGEVSGDDTVGGFTGALLNNREIINSYASGSVSGTGRDIGGFVGELWYGDIVNSFSISSVNGADNTAGFVGSKASGSITNSYSRGNVYGESGTSTGSFIGSNEVFDTAFGSGSITYLVDGISTTEIYSGPPTPSLFTTVNTGNKYGVDPELNSGLPYLLSLRDTYQSSTEQEAQNFSLSGTGILTLKIESKKEPSASIGFVSSQFDLKEMKIQFIPTSDNNKNEQVSGIQTSINQTSQVFVKVGEGLQLTLNSTSEKGLQLWVRSAEGKFILLGLVSFDEDGKAILPAMEFNDSGQFEIIFIDSDNSSLDTLELNKRLGSLVINVE